jgi:hypothetical protein
VFEQWKAGARTGSRRGAKLARIGTTYSRGMTDWLADGIAVAALGVSGYAFIDSRRRVRDADAAAKRATEAAERSAAAAERSAAAAEELAAGPPWSLTRLGDMPGRVELKNLLKHTAYRVTVKAHSRDVELIEEPIDETMHAGATRACWATAYSNAARNRIEVGWQDTEVGQGRTWETSVG